MEQYKGPFSTGGGARKADYLSYPSRLLSIIDIGCGDGRITNRLLPQYKHVVGLEQSSRALRYVRTEKILGSVEHLPFSDRSFDLVLCCEVLEHLPFKVYPRALEEIQRVAQKYIVVTVPNNEDIKKALITCPHCSCIFHPWRHLRSFSQKSITNIFNKFKVEIVRTYRPLVKVYPLLTVMERVARFFKLVSASSFPADALCPQCGYSSVHKVFPVNSHKERNRFNFLVPPAKILAVNKKSRGWLLVLYQRI